MRGKWLCVALVGVALATASGCGRHRGEPVAAPPLPETRGEPIPRPAPSGDARLAAANLGFGFRLLQELCREQPKDNVFLSPTSVALALAMAYNGVAGETKTAMAQALGLGALSTDDVNRGFSAMRALPPRSRSEPQATVALADALWVDKQFPLLPGFVDTADRWYGARAATLDFSDPRSAETINGWVAGVTHDAIPQVVSPRDLGGLSVSLLSAAYFKASWETCFEYHATKPAPFTLLSGRRKRLPTMSQGMSCPYLVGAGFRAVALPYMDQRYRMVILLPDPGSSLAAMVATLGSESWETWMGQFGLQPVDIQLPRFSVTCDFDLKAALTALGMGIAFDSGRADFSQTVSGGGVWIDQAKHLATLYVHEYGTVAAAATHIGEAMAGAEPPPPRPIPFVVDHPFLCAIEDTQTHALLFLGAIVDPK